MLRKLRRREAEVFTTLPLYSAFITDQHYLVGGSSGNSMHVGYRQEGVQSHKTSNCLMRKKNAPKIKKSNSTGQSGMSRKREEWEENGSKRPRNSQEGEISG